VREVVTCMQRSESGMYDKTHFAQQIDQEGSISATSRPDRQMEGPGTYGTMARHGDEQEHDRCRN